MLLSKEEFLKIASEKPEELYKIFIALTAKVEYLTEELKKLESRLNQNSSNSSKPPSSDQFKKKRSNKTSRRKQGGQPEHPGTNLKKVSNPDNTKEYRAPDSCEKCGSSLESVSVEIQTKQEFDIPKSNLLVTEHKIEIKRCSCGHCNKNTHAPDMRNHTYYGDNIKSLIIYLKNEQMLPYKRTRDLIYCIYGHTISEGTFWNMERDFAEILSPVDEKIKQEIIKSAEAGFDESSVRSEKENFWVHVAVTKSYTHFSFHAKRGLEGMESAGILPNFTGVAMHDFFKAYLHFLCEHAFCNAHILRELISVYENTKQVWAEMMLEVLMTALDFSKEGTKKDKEKSINEISKMYDLAISKGLEENPDKNIDTNKRVKHTKEFNLLHRMKEYKENIMLFLKNELVPFDNNLAERALRMLKVKMKISGCFRNQDAGTFFCKIRSFIDTCKKHKLNILEAIRNVWKFGYFVFAPLVKTAE